MKCSSTYYASNDKEEKKKKKENQFLKYIIVYMDRQGIWIDVFKSNIISNSPVQ